MTGHRKRTTTLALAALGLLPSALAGCGETEDAPRVQRALVVDASGLAPVTTASGWRITVSAARALITDLQLSRGGDTHAGMNPLRWLVGVAHAHPGHGAGGETVGSLPGRFVVDLAADGAPLGTITALTGPVDGLNFRLSDATAEDVAADDPLLGCGLSLEGAATQGDRTVPFTACLAFPDEALIEGAPLAHTIAGATGPALGLSLSLQDPFEPDTLFDGVDFDSAAGPLALRGDTDPNTNRLRRNAAAHDHWRGTVRAEE